MKLCTNKLLYYWLLCNAVITLCIGIGLSILCLFPSLAPSVLTVFFDSNIDIVVPYVIFVLIGTSLISLLYYHGVYRDRNR